MKKLFFTLMASLIAMTSQAQGTEVDKQAIEKQVDAMVTSWNKHDHSDMPNYSTVDFDWVNIVGMWWKNRKETQFATQHFHNGMFKNVSMEKNWVKIRFISPGVALAHFSSHIAAFTDPHGNKVPEGDDLALLVFVKQAGKWLITSGENVTINPLAQADNPILHMPR